jgi:hypothetical protein
VLYAAAGLVVGVQSMLLFDRRLFVRKRRRSLVVVVGVVVCDFVCACCAEGYFDWRRLSSLEGVIQFGDGRHYLILRLRSKTDILVAT